MAKRLTMAEIDTILTLHKAGHSQREIAALLGVNRETIGRHLASAKARIQPNAPTGNPRGDSLRLPEESAAGDACAGAGASTQPNAPTGSINAPADAVGPPISTDQPLLGVRPCGLTGQPCNLSFTSSSSSTSDVPSGPSSGCEPFREQILAKIEQGLEAVRIHQDLVEEHRDGAPSYYSVRRFVARLRRTTPLPFRRMECAPGEDYVKQGAMSSKPRPAAKVPRQP